MALRGNDSTAINSLPPLQSHPVQLLSRSDGELHSDDISIHSVYSDYDSDYLIDSAVSNVHLPEGEAIDGVGEAVGNEHATPQDIVDAAGAVDMGAVDMGAVDMGAVDAGPIAVDAVHESGQVHDTTISRTRTPRAATSFSSELANRLRRSTSQKSIPTRILAHAERDLYDVLRVCEEIRKHSNGRTLRGKHVISAFELLNMVILPNAM